MNEAGLQIPDFIGQDNVRRTLRHANDFWDHYGVTVHDEQRDGGDLIFFSRHGTFPTHVGIVRDTESYVHAPGKNNTRVEAVPIRYATIATSGLHRQLYARNPIGFKSPMAAIESPTYRYHQKAV